MVAEKVNAVFDINEIFLDVNIARRVYFRLGKQVVKWGVGYLWTPTDLINIEKKNILDSSQVRQGTYGLKIHVPFGTRANIYSFINMNNARHLSDISMANKVEVLFLNTEMALSVLLKNHNVPVYGFDFTSRVLTLDIHGEASLSYGDNIRRLRIYPWYITGLFPSLPAEMQYLVSISGRNVMDYRVRGKWIGKASLGFGRGFEVLDVKDRIRFDVEAFITTPDTTGTCSKRTFTRRAISCQAVSTHRTITGNGMPASSSPYARCSWRSFLPWSTAS